MEPFLETIELDIEDASELLFKVKVEGVEPSPAKVRLVCEVGDLAYMFNGHPTQDEGVVQFLLPALKDKLKAGLYQSRVEVLIENRYFAPVHFNLNFKKAVTVVAESIQVPQRRQLPQVSVTASQVVVRKQTPSVSPVQPVAHPIIIEEQEVRQAVQPVQVQTPVAVAPPVVQQPTVTTQQTRQQPTIKPQIKQTVQKSAPPPARFNSAITLKERYNSRIDETHVEKIEKTIEEVDESNERLLKELAKGFIRSSKKK